jgi:ribosomal-protein-alanine N-acetyltransferase
MLPDCSGRSLVYLILIILPIGAKTVEEEKSYLHSLQEKIKSGLEHQYTIFYKGEIAGGIGLKISSHEKSLGEIGYFVGKEFQGKGLATEATRIGIKKAKELGLVGLRATTHPHNYASQKVLEKSGFTLVGRMEKYMKIRGELQPRYLYWLPLT